MKRLLTLLFCMFGMFSCIMAQEKGLKDAYKDYFSVGVAINRRNLTSDEQINLIKENFNSITCENEMKPVSLHPAEGVWTWAAADSIADFCRKNGIAWEV